ncbi:MAG: hypothetical protein AB3N16_08010 [Flavobacteriaceae bacterium]
MLRTADKHKTATEATEQIVTKTARKGDTVTFYVPRVRYKDTTIRTVNRVGSVIETRYDQDGNIDLINCLTSTVDEMREENRRLLEAVSQKNVESEKETQGININIIAIAAMVLIMWFLDKRIPSAKGPTN